MPTHADTTVSRVKASGVGAASPVDLVAVGFSRRQEDAEDAEHMAREILKRYNQIGRILDISTQEMREYAGLEDFEALRAQALMELGRRAALAGKGEFDIVDCAEDVARILNHLHSEKREHVCVLMLDAQNQVIRWSTIHIGTLTMSMVGPREVFREAIREGASSIILAHNHPSGDTTPSPEDIEVTAKIAEIGKMLDIQLVDHIIIGDAKRAVSLRRKGLIK
ncbi:MAG TPA: DNA repair protein RadC [Fimbriimonadaceae bacterium]